MVPKLEDLDSKSTTSARVEVENKKNPFNKSCCVSDSEETDSVVINPAANDWHRRGVVPGQAITEFKDEGGEPEQKREDKPKPKAKVKTKASKKTASILANGKRLVHALDKYYKKEPSPGGETSSV